MSKAKIFNFLVNAFLMIMALSMILVFVVLIIGSFKPNSDLLKIPDGYVKDGKIPLSLCKKLDF